MLIHIAMYTRLNVTNILNFMASFVKCAGTRNKDARLTAMLSVDKPFGMFIKYRIKFYRQNIIYFLSEFLISLALIWVIFKSMQVNGISLTI